MQAKEKAKFWICKNCSRRWF